MNKENILKKIEKNNHIAYKLSSSNKKKALELLFENELLALKLQ